MIRSLTYSSPVYLTCWFVRCSGMCVFVSILDCRILLSLKPLHYFACAVSYNECCTVHLRICGATDCLDVAHRFLLSKQRSMGHHSGPVQGHFLRPPAIVVQSDSATVHRALVEETLRSYRFLQLVIRRR
ncbi:hypothetical protein BDW22DRAFT_613852 [Trametopsis cervina]|nr:hypothetical protein BDW22DRAFT_613852 [Trametopsis cervina]